jgi:hypothetical protein
MLSGLTTGRADDALQIYMQACDEHEGEHDSSVAQLTGCANESATVAEDVAEPTPSARQGSCDTGR